jgi:hypothetical protein
MCIKWNSDCVFAILISFLIFAGIILFGMIIIHFVIGIIYLGQCPIQPFIPIYHLVAGCSGISLVIIIGCIILYYAADGKSYSLCRSPALKWSVVILAIMLGLFLFIWEIVGSIYVFPVRNKNETQFNDSTLNTYCNPTLYWISFSICIVFYCLLAIGGTNVSGVVTSQ